MFRVLMVLFGILALGLASAKSKKEARGEAGVFDYYVLSLSWSPDYCASPAGANDSVQCSGTRQFDFVLHGLWPQYEKGYPQSCPSSIQDPGKALVDRMLDIMPSPKLVRHEWEKHGTCSGLKPVEYFAKARTAFANWQIPPEYQSPKNAITTNADEMRRKFLKVNPGVPRTSVAILCGGRFLREVRVCLDKNLKPRACGADIRDTCRSELIVRPIR